MGGGRMELRGGNDVDGDKVAQLDARGGADGGENGAGQARNTRVVLLLDSGTVELLVRRAELDKGMVVVLDRKRGRIKTGNHYRWILINT